MRTPGNSHLTRSLVAVIGSVLVVAGAGVAAARTMSTPPWRQPLLTATATDTTDPAQKAADAQAFFDAFKNDCGTAVLGDTTLTDTTTDPTTVQAFGGLVDALSAGQIDHMVQSVRVLLQNCEAHANDGLRNALYHHGLNWVRQYQHELWLEQKFADKWPDGKPGGGSDAASTHGKPDTTTHGNPHAGDPTWSPGGGHGNAFGHTK
jgi:hypothetical protein